MKVRFLSAAINSAVNFVLLLPVYFIGIGIAKVLVLIARKEIFEKPEAWKDIEEEEDPFRMY